MQDFDATQYVPNQGTPKHPNGEFQALVSNTEMKPPSTGKGMMLAVTFQTNVGSIVRNYNIEHENPDAQRIGREQLSALCHATGVMRLTFGQHAYELRNGKCVIVIADQTKNPQYNEVSLVKTPQGEMPTGQARQQSAPQSQPPAPQPSQQPYAAPPAPQQPPAPGGWGGQPGQPPAPPAPAQQPAWATPQQQPPAYQPQPMAAPSPMPQSQPAWARAPGQ